MKNIWAGRGDAIRTGDLMTAVRLAGLDWDTADVENCMVNMIEQRIISGYVSHGTGIKLGKNPFPNISVRFEASDL
jgi:hypothetical protein